MHIIKNININHIILNINKNLILKDLIENKNFLLNNDFIFEAILFN